MTLQKVANQFPISEKICMNKVSARWVPKQLTEDQKASRMIIAKEYLGLFNNKNNFLNCIVTGDKMWVHYTEPETKAQSRQ